MAQSAPLDGIRVLDLSRVLALPFATMVLSDLGAEVIKIERPQEGDETRTWGPPFLGNSKESAYFLCVNRNKKSVTVDISKPEGQEIIKDLAKESDVLVENYKVGGLKKYSLDYENIKKVNPKIIYCSLTGFGQYGPKSHLPGYDFIIQGLSGLMSITGPPEEPYKVGVAITDVIAGLYADIAILASLLKRNRISEPEYIDVALLDCAVSALANVASNYLISGKIPKRYGNAHPNIVPYQTFKTKDGYFNLAVGNDGQFKKLTELLENESLKAEKFRTNADRVIHRTELIGILQEIFIKKETDFWVELFQKNKIPVGRINNLQDICNDEHFIERDMVKTVKHKVGTFKMIGTPIKLKESNTKPIDPPPLLGEHTEEVLKRILHYDSNKIKNLRGLGVIG